jgi:hypothetical protein
MTAMPSWSPGDPEAIVRPRTADGGSGPAPFRGLLGAIASADHLDPPEISQRFKIGDMHVVLELGATTSVDDLVDTAGKRLKRRGYACGPTYRTEVAGLADGRARVVARRKKFGREAGLPQLQLYAMTGPYSLILTVAAADAPLARGLGPIRLDPPV